MCCQRFEGSVAQQSLDGLPVRRSPAHNESLGVSMLWLIFERSKVLESCKLKLFCSEEASFEWDKSGFEENFLRNPSNRRDLKHCCVYCRSLCRSESTWSSVKQPCNYSCDCETVSPTVPSAGKGLLFAATNDYHSHLLFALRRKRKGFIMCRLHVVMNDSSIASRNGCPLQIAEGFF